MSNTIGNTVRCLSFDPGLNKTAWVIVEYAKSNQQHHVCNFGESKSDLESLSKIIYEHTDDVFVRPEKLVNLIAIESLAAYIGSGGSAGRASNLLEVARVVGNLEALAFEANTPTVLLPAVGTKTRQGWRHLLGIPQRRIRGAKTADALVADHLRYWLDVPKTNNHVRDAIGLGVAALSVHLRESRTHEKR